MIVNLSHLGSLVLPTPCGVLMVDLKLGMVCKTCLTSCSTIDLAWTWWFDVTSLVLILEAWMALALAYSSLTTLSSDELALFMFQTSSKLGWSWHRLEANFLRFDIFQVLLHLDIVFWQTYLSWRFCIFLGCLSALVMRRSNIACLRFELFRLHALFEGRWMDFTHLNV